MTEDPMCVGVARPLLHCSPPSEVSWTSGEACGPVAFWRVVLAGEPRPAAGKACDRAICLPTLSWLQESLQVEIQLPSAEPLPAPHSIP